MSKKRNRPKISETQKKTNIPLKIISVFLVISGGFSVLLGFLSFAAYATEDVITGIAALLIAAGGAVQLGGGITGIMDKMRAARMCSFIMLLIGVLGFVSNIVGAIQGGGIPSILSGAAQMVLPVAFFAVVQRER